MVTIKTSTEVVFLCKKNIFLSFVLIFMYMHSCVCVPQVCEYLKTPSRVSSPLGLELQAVVSHLT